MDDSARPSAKAKSLLQTLIASSKPKQGVNQKMERGYDEILEESNQFWEGRHNASIRLPIQHLHSQDIIIAKLDEERKLNLARGSALTKCKVLQQGLKRCQKCTLPIPCKHYSDTNEVSIIDVGPNMMFSATEWRTLQEEERLRAKKFALEIQKQKFFDEMPKTNYKQVYEDLLKIIEISTTRKRPTSTTGRRKSNLTS